ncbi:MAG TPA: HNH endonuclease [Tepidisphaeraceae bacterium]|jgi:hypothetical protein
MPILMPAVESAQEQYELGQWVKAECYRFYVQQRRLHCAPTELLDLWLLEPYCAECSSSMPFPIDYLPRIDSGEGWRVGLIANAGFNALMRVESALSADSNFGFPCRGFCRRLLRPWRDDEVYIAARHVEEHFGIPLEVDAVQPSRALRDRIIHLYGARCFGCGTTDGLHIDHIIPRSRGGTAAFRNVQPLCSDCGQRKANVMPTEVHVDVDKCFYEPISDAQERLF